MELRIGNGISAFFLLLFEEVNNDNIQFNFSEKMFCFVCGQRALPRHISINCCFMCVPQSGVEFDALSDGVPYPTPLHQTSRCEQKGWDRGKVSLRQFLHLMMSSITRNNTLFVGDINRCAPLHNMVELENTYYHDLIMWGAVTQAC